MKIAVGDVLRNLEWTSAAVGRAESIGSRARIRLEIPGSPRRDEALVLADHGAAVRHLLLTLQGEGLAVEAAGHRIVHGGDRFVSPALIDDAVIRAIDAFSPLAPAHNPAAILGIQAARSVLGERLPMVAVFDTAFGRTIRDYAAAYAIPRSWSTQYGIKRFGFHGIAHSEMARRFASFGKPRTKTPRIVSLQLGHGCSAAAILGNRCVDNSMGFTPLEGLMMATRSGDLDPAIIGLICEKEKLTAGEVVRRLETQSGLLGLSGSSADMRQLLSREGKDMNARLAIAAFCYRIRKYIGAYAAALSGIDALLIGGGIGENAPVIRERICAGFEWAGLVFDTERNRIANAPETLISAESSPAQIWVIRGDEESAIARDSASTLQRQGEQRS